MFVVEVQRGNIQRPRRQVRNTKETKQTATKNGQYLLNFHHFMSTDQE